jgi:hypothetical protein
LGDTSAPLARALKSEVGSDHELYKVAAGYVLDYALEAPELFQVPDFDAMTNAERLAHLGPASRWPEWTLRVRVSDPAWLFHLRGVRPYPVPEGDFAAPPPSPPRTFSPVA